MNQEIPELDVETLKYIITRVQEKDELTQRLLKTAREYNKTEEIKLRESQVASHSMFIADLWYLIRVQEGTWK